MGLVTLPNLTKTSADDNLFSDAKDNDQAIVDVVNGNIEAANLASNAVTTAKIADANVTADKISSAAAEDLGLGQTGTVRRGVTSIATEETTTSTSYTTLTTPDQVANVVLPTDGLIFVQYRALWKLTGASNAGAAAIFIGSNQVKVATGDSVPVVADIALSSAGDNYGYLNHITASGSANIDSSLVTTGMTVVSPAPIEAAAGTHTIGIRFHVNATAGGTLSVKERKLWVWTMGF